MAALVAAAVVILLAVACGGGPAPPTPTVTPSPSPLPTSTPQGSSARDVTTVPPTRVLDMASDPPLLTILAGPGDLQTGGTSLARGDFNADGVDDLLLGAPFGDGPSDSREDAGEAYVIFGTAALGTEIDLTKGTEDLTVYGALAGDNLGFSVAAGDLNGDGIDDIVVGAPGSNGLTSIRTDLGEAYVIFGSPTLAGTVDLARIEQDFTFRPAEGFTRVGTTFAIGDVNADGIDDLIAGGPFGGRVEGTPPGSPRTTVGEVYVVFGGPELRGEMDLAEGEVGVRLKGAQELDNFGQGVAAGDLNGDGIDDIIVTAKRADGPDDSRIDGGEAFVFYGSRELSGKVDSVDADVTIYGAEEGDTLGDIVASGDLSGDGLTDIVLSARFADGPENLRSIGGEAYVIFGAESMAGVIDLAETAPGALVHGRDRTDTMPSALAVADFGGDGIDDLALASAFADGPDDSRSEGGEAYVLAGDSLTGETDLRVDVEGRLFIFGAAPADQLGLGLLWLDLNDDGRQELLLMAPGSPDAETPGKLYLVDIAGG